MLRSSFPESGNRTRFPTPRPSPPVPLERGDLPAAARHLEAHVRANPDQVIFRAQFAELLARLERLPEAQAQFEAALAQAQDGPPVVQKERVHYHTRLMEIAQERHDEYAEHFPRGTEGRAGGTAAPSAAAPVPVIR